MSTEFYYNDAATWRKAKELHYNDGGTWRKLKEAWYKDGASWIKVFAGLVYTAISGSSSWFASLLTATSTLTVARGGTFTLSGSGAGGGTNSPSGATDWVTPSGGTVGDAYHVRATKTVGTNPSGSALATWLALTSSRSWTLTTTSGQVKDCTLTVDISIDGGATTLTSGTVTLSADST